MPVAANLGPLELVLIFLAVVFLFGARRLPGLFRSVGESLREIRRGRDEEEGGSE